MLLKPIYKELEFFSHLKELGPSEDERPRDFAVLEDSAALAAYLEGIPAGARLAVTFTREPREAGLSYRAGEARSVPVPLLGALIPMLQDPTIPKTTADLKTLTQNLLHAGVEAQGFVEDVSLSSFLLDADPGGCAFETLVERRLDLRAGSSRR